MSNSDAVRRQFGQVLAKYQPLLPSWPALMGNVLGVTHVPGRSGWVYVRVGSDEVPGMAFNNSFPVRANLLCMVGYDNLHPNLFQVLAMDAAYAAADSGDEMIPAVVAHAGTHGLFGGDPTFIQKKQFVPLQATPTSPQSMKIWVQADVYPWGSAWNWFPRTASADLTARIAGTLGKARYVLVSIDGATNALQYTNGDEFTILLPPADIGDLIPAPPAGSVPIAAVYLPYGTIYLDWNSFYDVRLFNQPVGGSLLPSVHDHSTAAQGGQNLRAIQELQAAAATELTIAAGIITRTQAYHSVDTEADAASDDLDTINGGTEGDLLIIRAEDSARTVVVKTGTGNIVLSSGTDISLEDDTDHLRLVFDGTNWCDDYRVAGGGGGGLTLTGPTRIVYATGVITEYATIQLALNACAQGDVVYAPPGLPVENLTWPAQAGVVLAGFPVVRTPLTSNVYGTALVGTISIGDVAAVIQNLYITGNITLNGASSDLAMINCWCWGDVVDGGTAGDLKLQNTCIYGDVDVDNLDILGGWITGTRTVAGTTTFKGEVLWAETVGDHAHAGVAGDGGVLRVEKLLWIGW